MDGLRRQGGQRGIAVFNHVKRGIRPRSQVRRLPDRGAYDRETIHAILDAGLVCHVGFVSEGQPFVIPMNYGRPPDARELAVTAVLEVPIEEASAKIRTGPPKDDPEDLSLPVWAGRGAAPRPRLAARAVSRDRQGAGVPTT